MHEAHRLFMKYVAKTFLLASSSGQFSNDYHALRTFKAKKAKPYGKEICRVS